MPLSLRAAWRAAFLGACACPASALAAPTIDTVIVTGARDPDDPAVVAAARKDLSRTPGAVSVISQESYSRREALALDDMLRDAPGVYAQRKWGGDVRISIRGSGLGNANHNRGLLIAQDGVPLNEADGYGDSQAVDPLNTRYVEVWRGGNALRFGGALLGGAVNMVTPRGRDAGYGLQARIDGGAFATARQHLALARGTEDWDLYLGATNQTGQGWRPQSQQNLQFGAFNLGRRFGDDRELRLVVSGSSIAQEIPGALTWAQFTADPRQPAPANYANDQGRNQRSLRVALQADWRLGPSIVVQGAVYGAWKDLDHPIFQVIDQQSRNWGAFGRLAWEGTIGELRADAFAGAWLRTGDLDSNFYVNLKGARGAPTSITQQNADAVDVFAEGRLFVTDRLAVIAGGSWGAAGREFRSFAPPGGAVSARFDASRRYQWLAPRLGLLWENSSGDQLFANLTRSVEPPNLGSMSPTNLGFAPIRAQAAWTAEAGARGRRGPLAWDVTIYRSRLEGELLQYTPGLPGPGGAVPATTFNAGRTIHQGIEAALDWRPVRRVRLRQSWTVSDFRFRHDPQYGDRRLPVAPKSFYRAELRYEYAAGWFVAPAVEWSPSDVWVDFANTAKAPGYAVWSLGAGFQLSERLKLFLDARNLADEAYVSNVQPVTQAVAGSAAYWPGDGRSVYGGLTWSF